MTMILSNDVTAPIAINFLDERLNEEEETLLRTFCNFIKKACLDEQSIRASGYLYLTFILKVPILMVGILMLSMSLQSNSGNKSDQQPENNYVSCNTNLFGIDMNVDLWFGIKFFWITAYDIFYGFWNWVKEYKRNEGNLPKEMPHIAKIILLSLMSTFTLLWNIIGCVITIHDYKNCEPQDLNRFVLALLIIETFLTIAWVLDYYFGLGNNLASYLRLRCRFRIYPSCDLSDQVQLTEVVFKKTEQPVSNISCSICLDDYAESEKVIQLSCLHLFHKQCIKKWIDQIKVECPNCRTIMIILNNDEHNNNNNNMVQEVDISLN